MASIGRVCSGCKNNLPKKEYMICSTCKLAYDLLCANLTSKRFYLMDSDKKSKWLCLECRSKLPKTDNSNTPVRALNRPVASDEDCNLNLGDENVNITMRVKKQRSKSDSTDSNVSEDRLRKIVRQEMTEIVTNLFSEHIANFKHQISEFQESLSFISSQYDALLQTVNEKNEIINSLVSKSEYLTSQVYNLTDRLGYIEQNMRSTNIEISGLPEHKLENLTSTVMQLGNIVDNPIADTDIMHVTRIAKINKENNRPRSVVVKLCSQRRRDELLAAVTRFNRKNRDKKLNSEHLGYGGRCEPVFVSEHLTLINKRLHAAARSKAKEAGFKFVWIRDGRIFVRRNEQSHATCIKNEESLKLIV